MVIKMIVIFLIFIVVLIEIDKIKYEYKSRKKYIKWLDNNVINIDDRQLYIKRYNLGRRYFRIQE